ncbi:NUDIX domain-containing protein [Verrucomicrobiales bacterium BCK34]|nr:NUDIX domain-containing protein [Verrucomicrobiales bacterium BCK34]
MSFTYEYPRGALTVDCVVFGFDGGELKILLIQRGVAPFKGEWALPGGFVGTDETLDEAARRELKEETGLDNVFLEQLYTFGAVNRDPRERVVSVAYVALVQPDDYTTEAQTDADDARWFPLSEIPKLAFDHREILDTGIQRLRGKLRYEPIGFELLPEKFTLPQLQKLYESVLNAELDKRNFRKKVLSFGLLIPLDEKLREGPHRPAQLYRFDPARYEALKNEGFLFEI